MVKKRYTKKDIIIMLILAILASPLASLIYALVITED